MKKRNKKEDLDISENITVGEHEQNMEVYEHHMPFLTLASCGCRLNILELTDPSCVCANLQLY